MSSSDTAMHESVITINTNMQENLLDKKQYYCTCKNILHDTISIFLPLMIVLSMFVIGYFVVISLK